MKLKEWGLVRHGGRGRKARASRKEAANPDHEDNARQRGVSSTSLEVTPVDPESLEHRTKSGGWQVMGPDELTNAQPTFMGLLTRSV